MDVDLKNQERFKDMLQLEKCKLCRREGEKLFLKGSRCESAKCAMTKRPYAPGKNKKNANTKLSDYAKQLRAKQLAKKVYKLRENTLHKYYILSAKSKDTTVDKLFALLETRLDNVVYKLGFAQSMSFARQLVSHKHILIDNKTVNIPSYHVKNNQKISVDKNIIPMLKNTKKKEHIPAWLELTSDKFGAKILRMPTKLDTIHNIDIQSIIEFYSR
jgi:small subunit ribosomal protein S4